jgi:hypothetical protein
MPPLSDPSSTVNGGRQCIETMENAQLFSLPRDMVDEAWHLDTTFLFESSHPYCHEIARK